MGGAFLSAMSEDLMRSEDDSTILTYADVKRLAQRLGRPATSMLALAPCNDPFYLRPARVAAAHWFADAVAPIFAESADDLHIRRLHYRLITGGLLQKPDGKPYENTDNDWDLLCSASRDARLLALVDADRFVDRRAGAPVYLHIPEDIASAAALDVDAELVRPEQETLPAQDYAPANSEFPELPTVSIAPPSINEPYALELWIEKSTMNDILEPIAHRRGVSLIAGIGELSLTHCRDFVKRCLEHRKKGRILYLSDFDPAGDRMPVSAARKIEYEIRRDHPDGLDVKVAPLVLTAAQARRYRLPRTPVKETDRGRGRFEAQHGEGAVELDALEALHPGELARIVTRAIDRYQRPTREARAAAQRIVVALRDQLNAIRETVLAAHADEIAALQSEFAVMQQSVTPQQDAIEAILADAAERCAGHIDAINSLANAFYDRAAAVWQAIGEQIEAQAPDPEAVDWPEVEPVSEPDLLYDFSRGYVEQIDRDRRQSRQRRGDGA